MSTSEWPMPPAPDAPPEAREPRATFVPPLESLLPAAVGEVAESKGSPRAIRARLLTALAGGGLLTVLFQALSEDYGLTIGDATQKFLILLAALVFGYSHVDHKSAG